MYESSQVAECNEVEFVGLDNGKVLIPVYDWKTYLSKYFKPLNQIKKFHHFHFSKDFNEGEIFYKEYNDTDKMSINILRLTEIPNKDVLPFKVLPAGLSKERKEYLYKEIRKFCRHGTEDQVAPKPS